MKDSRPARWLTLALVAAAQQLAALEPIPRFAFGSDPLTISRLVEPGKPFTVAGERGAIFGRQSGRFEAWLYPVKILSQFSITAELANYPVPIDVAAQAAFIEVAPAMTTITYSHAAFTVKQRMFAPRGDAAAGAVVLFEIASVRRLRLTFRFRPEMLRMWPAPNFGTPNGCHREAAITYCIPTTPISRRRSHCRGRNRASSRPTRNVPRRIPSNRSEERRVGEECRSR